MCTSGGSDEICGVGLELETTGTYDDVLVAGCLGGSSSHTCGVILRGDMLLSVDGISFFGQPLGQVRAAIRGPRGSIVRVTLQRVFALKRQQQAAGDGVYEVVLTRQHPSVPPPFSRGGGDVERRDSSSHSAGLFSNILDSTASEQGEMNCSIWTSDAEDLPPPPPRRPLMHKSNWTERQSHVHGHVPLSAAGDKDARSAADGGHEGSRPPHTTPNGTNNVHQYALEQTDIPPGRRAHGRAVRDGGSAAGGDRHESVAGAGRVAYSSVASRYIQQGSAASRYIQRGSAASRYVRQGVHIHQEVKTDEQQHTNLLRVSPRRHWQARGMPWVTPDLAPQYGRRGNKGTIPSVPARSGHYRNSDGKWGDEQGGAQEEEEEEEEDRSKRSNQKIFEEEEEEERFKEEEEKKSKTSSRKRFEFSEWESQDGHVVSGRQGEGGQELGRGAYVVDNIFVGHGEERFRKGWKEEVEEEEVEEEEWYEEEVCVLCVYVNV